MKNRIIDSIDFEKVNNLLEGFNKTTGFVTAILDLKGNVLSKSGWRQICTDFHRVNPETAKKCTISDTELAGKLAEGEKYHFYKCLNGLVDVAVPIVINGEHIANLFSGQFFFEEPDKEFFRKQAEKYGFKNEPYLKALEKVPVVSQERVKTAMDFMLNMTQLISEMTFQKMELTELNKTFRESEDRFSKIFKSSPIAISIASMSDGKLTEVNDTWCNLMGFSEEEALGHNVEELEIIDTKTRKKNRKEFTRKGIIKQLESNISTKSGAKKIIHSSVEAITIGNDQFFINLVTDITERKQAEQDLKNSEEKFKSVFEAANVGKSITLPSGEMDVNEAFCKMLGYSRKELQNKKWQEITPEEEIPGIQKILESLLKGEKDSARFEKRYICKNGTHLLVDLSVSVRRDKNGKLLYFITTIIDITERKLAEKDLKESKFFFEQLFIQSSISTQLLDSEGWCVKINPKLSELFGVNPEDIEGKKYNILRDGEIIRTGVINHLNRVFKNKETVKWEVNFDIQHASETTGVNVSKPEKRWFQNLAYPIVDVEGKLIYVIVQHEDITVRKQAEEATKESEEKYRNLFNTVQVGIFRTKVDGSGIIDLNDHFLRIFGYSKEEVYDRSTFLHWADPKRRDELLELLQKKGHVENYECELLNKKEEIINCITSVRIHPQQGILEGSIIDITERKKSELEIKKLNEELDKKVKDRTKELETKYEELNQLNKFFVDRELRMMELKEKINRLEKGNSM